MTTEDFLQRLEAVLPRHMPGDSYTSEADEIRAVLKLAPSSREDLLLRLEAADRYVANPSAKAADEEAAKLGMKRRNFYYMLAKLKALGPARALSPRPKGYRKKTHLDDEVAEIIRSAISHKLAAEPEALLVDVIHAVHFAFGERRLKPPADGTIALWLSRYREDRGADQTSEQSRSAGVFGRQFLIDGSGAAFLLERGDGVVLGRISVLIDVETGLICAIGVGEDYSAATRDLMLDLKAEKRLPAALFEQRSSPENVHWVVPEQCVDSLGEWAAALAASGVMGTSDSRGSRRYGDRLLRIVGQTIGWLKLFPRHTPPVPAIPGGGQNFPVFTLELAKRSIGALADERNYELARRQANERRTMGPAREAQLARWLVEPPIALELIREGLEAAFAKAPREYVETWPQLKR